jgi:FdhD protein
VGGFALLSSRCSYELVEKAAIAGCPMLVTVSAPTSLAIARAAEAGLTLVSLARSDAYLTDAETAV